GRDGFVLGALASAGISEQDYAASAARCADGTGAGRDERGLGLSIRAERHVGETKSGATAQSSGLASALQLAIRARRGGSRCGRRIREAVSSERRSESAAGLQHSADAGH